MAISSHNEIGKIYTRPWGTYQTLALGENYQVKTITVNAGGRLSLQKHQHRDEHWIVVSGTPTITLNADTKTFAANEALFIPKQALHRIENLATEPAIIIEVQTGSYLGEDDIVRVEDVYGRDVKK